MRPSWDGLPISPGHVEYLRDQAGISADIAQRAGIRSAVLPAGLPEWAQDRHWAEQAVPAIIFPWHSPDGRVVEQIRPDIPLTWDGENHKYLWPTGAGAILNQVVDDGEGGTVLIVEGTKQALAAASWAPAGVAVYGVGGCRNWSSDGIPLDALDVVEGRDVVICLDADVSTNLDVYKAALDLKAAVRAEGAASVKFARLAAKGTNGLDDILAKRDEATRTAYLERLITDAAGKPADRKPDPKKAVPEPGASGYGFFDEGGGLLVRTLSDAIRDRMPAALTEEHKVALYRGGVYHIHGAAFAGAVADLLGERFRPGHRSAAEEFTAATLFNLDMYLPLYPDYQLLNVPNGMLDLATQTLKPHDPSYYSTNQVPISWDPDARCPAYEAWVEKCGVVDQIDDLEEATAAMLDPSRTPSKAVFLFGPSRSGKSTYLRLMQRVAGARNLAAVSLHQLTQNRFAAANVFGKILNCAADLSAAHVEDISIFKMMSGEDPIQADRKYGGQFAFTNRALFAFSANELPTVGESSRAYVERIKPFSFPISFAGREDPSIEAAMMLELPGILARWVRAWQRRTERGTALQTNPVVLREFETRSDRVRQWLDEHCVIWGETPDGKTIRPGMTVPPARATSPRALAQAFNDWAKDNHSHGMGQRKIIDRLATVDGVYEVRVSPAKSRGFNVTVRPDDDGPFRPEDPFGDPGGSYEGTKLPPVAVTAAQSATSGSYEGTKLPPVAVTGDQTATASAQVEGQISSKVAEVAVSGPPIYTYESLGTFCGLEGSEDTCKSPRLGVGLETATSATFATALFAAPAPPYEPIDVATLDARGAVTLPAGVLALDIETAGVEKLWSCGPEFVRLVGYQLGDQITVSPDPWALAGQIAQARLVVGHNVMSFDLVAYAKDYGIDLIDMAAKGQVFDTMLAGILNDPPDNGSSQEQILREYSLDTMAARLVGATKSGDLKALAEEFGGFDRIPTDDQRYVEYLVGDVDLTARLACELKSSAYVRREHRVAAIAAQIRMNGFRVDVDELNRRIVANQQARRTHLAALTLKYRLPTTKADGKESKSPHATKEGKAAIVQAFTDLGVTLPNTENGQPSFGKVALAQVTESHATNPGVLALVDLVSSLNGVRTVYETVGRYLVGDRVHPEIGLFQASGRWSTTKPGLTVFGKRGGKYREREVFLADEGHVIVSVDLAQVDARAIAALSQDRAYLAMFEPGLDLHSEVAKRIWGDPERRDDAKGLGHGWNYGMGIAGLMRNAKVDEDTARRFDQGMCDQFPRLVEWRTEVRQLGESGVMLDNGFGRLMRVDPNRAWTQAPALMGQGAARDIAMEGLLRLPGECLPMLRAFVHDEVVLSVPADVVEDVERTVVAALSFPWKPPGAEFEVQIEAGLAKHRGRNWGDVYAK
jgi:P4 family phage/plasmid primase-like protien